MSSSVKVPRKEEVRVRKPNQVRRCQEAAPSCPSARATTSPRCHKPTQASFTVGRIEWPNWKAAMAVVLPERATVGNPPAPRRLAHDAAEAKH